ncbi:M48 family metalloprotease [Donghicola sp. C2-DW-16]|uniref:M48 family metalloprotease n=1 Tax=Donghicola mangrovi TaxID=2729614 RepID=A0ABX2PBX7_9RHOB|nr:M48 family metalloprotease [Donghicola mangrovi]NVO26979.1 M48 family metalloprotease [Donghicola mangrovi]
MRLAARVLAAALCLSVIGTLPAKAVGLLRDPDIEHALNTIASPILNAAGLGARVKVLVVNDQSLNAFVVDTDHIFIHAGLLARLENARQLQSVIAHEAAHISNGHIARRMTNARTARTSAGLGLALAAAAAASGAGGAAAGIAIGTQSSAQRVLFAHTRAEEASADQAGVRYMVNAGINPDGAVEVIDIFRGQEALSVSRQDPYTRTHPLSQDRFRALQGFAAAYGGQAWPDSGAADYWFARAQGKLTAFTRAPSWTLRRAKSSATDDIRLMREAVAYHRQPDVKKAVATIDKLASARPKDPYVQELRAQILLESRNFPAAANAYGVAVSLSPKDPLILGGYGRALLALDTADGNKRALAALEKARSLDPYSSGVLRDLGMAYAKAGQNGMASLVTAERYALTGRLKDAALHAKRAEGLLPRGSAPWQRAQDVLTAAKAAPK